ncbi:MAG: hypothetical protein ACOYL3_10460 [Desulfuromonadaceae bacterium]
MKNTIIPALNTLKLQKIEYFGKHYEVRLVQDSETRIFIIQITNMFTNATQSYKCPAKSEKEFPVFYENRTVDGLPDQIKQDIQNGSV